MLEKLSDEQILLMENVKNEYVHLLDKKTNDKDVVDGIKFIYKISGLKEPDVKIFDSPFAAQVYLNKSTFQRIPPLYVAPRIHQHVQEQIFNKESELSQKIGPKAREELSRGLESHVLSIVRQTYGFHVYDRVNIHTRREIEKQLGRNRPMCYFTIEVSNTPTLLAKLSICDYIDRIGIAKNDLHEKYKIYLKSGIFSSTFLNGLAVVGRNPLRLSRDDRERLHNQEGYAIEWADGYGQNFVHGVFFELDLFNNIFIYRGLPGKDILEIRNLEQKAIAIQFFGYDKLINELGAKKIGEWRVKNAYTGIESLSELYDFEIRDTEDNWRSLRGRFLKLQDHSTGKITVLGVPVISETETVKGAIAWSFGMAEGEYNLVIET